MWFGREGSHGACMVVRSCCDFQTLAATPTHIELYAFHIQLYNHDHINSFSSKKKKQEEKR